MQLHVASLQTTAFAFNNWNPGNVAGLGIGNNLNGPYPDWTVTANSNSYSVQTLGW
jgi:hypothetical protein